MQLETQAIAEKTGVFPKRFVFAIRSNGVLTREIMPDGMLDNVGVRPGAESISEFQDVTLSDKNLPAGMKAINQYKDKVTLIQGLSGRMMSGGHEAGFGAPGAYSGKMIARKETIDWALAKHLGGVIPHIGFTMDALGTSVCGCRASG